MPEKTDDSFVEKAESSFALANNEMFLNSIAQRVTKQKEVAVRTNGGSNYIGFITGLDDEWMSLTTTEKRTLVLVNLVNVDTIEETGRSLQRLRADRALDRRALEEIMLFTETITSKARTYNWTRGPRRNLFPRVEED